MKEQLFYKNFSNLSGLEFDFNGLSLFLDKYNLSTKISSNFINDFIVESVYQVRGVHTTPEFSLINSEIGEKFNPDKKASDLDLFFSMVSGTKSISHHDACSVFILSLNGKVFYRVGTEGFELNPGDLLVIPKGVTHKAIGLTPRITASYAFFGNEIPEDYEVQVERRRQMGLAI